MLYNLLVRDIFEICIYSSCIFTFCKWLTTDKTKNILIYFFAYSAAALCAWVFQLPTLAPFLLTYAPVALLLFIVLHEKTLQRNLVSLCSIRPAQTHHEDWLETVISGCLTTINANKSITIVIERSDSLNYFIQAPFVINADISKHVLDILLSSTSYDEKKMLWIDINGKIRGINVTWIAPQRTREDELFYTLQSDAIILHAHPLTRTFVMTIQGTETTNITAHQVHTMLKKHLSSFGSPKHKGAYRENNTSEKSLPL